MPMPGPGGAERPERRSVMSNARSLAVLVLADVLRRFMYGSEPVSMLMMGVGAVAV